MTICFDVDGTLIYDEREPTLADTPRYSVINSLFEFYNAGHTIYVWSGGGISYAERWVAKLGLSGKVTVVAKGSFVPDLAIDDELVDLGRINLTV